MIIFECPRCGTKVTEKDENVGSLIACTNCGGLVEVPSISFTEKTLTIDELRQLRAQSESEV